MIEDGRARTLFELEHTVHIDEKWNQYGPGAVGVGWDLTLLGPGLHLSSKATTDKHEFAAWSASNEGKQWCRASIAAGTDKVIARAAANQTAAFYLGSSATSKAGG